ncbi:hypothetical protein HNY73_004287 [Argiope bruennichi]|uniref:Uncharacterized protein n=1 Tax=Argiope bruennichi TaxID=94029 RepID=A0A8T0FRB7_ARGBR|nr:hypothetical protein HNY73_004287 [Argiope bruennichi]
MATPDETTNKMAQLKRKRKTIRGNITRFSVEISNIKDDSSIEDVEYTCNRLTTTLNEMKITDNEIHNLLSDEEYENDILQCESYNDNAEFAIFRAKKIIQNKLAPTAATNNFTDLAINNNNLAMNLNPCITTPAIQSYTVKLPTIKLEPFNGDVELWQSFWEQFQSSIDNNPNLSVIDKYVFLRGYSQDEPKRLVDGISIIADTYEATKKLLMDKYGDKNRIIQDHLDFLENLTPIKNPSLTSLNEVFIECNRRLQALRALREDVNSYGRILTPKILRAFPDDICRCWIIFAKRQKISEGNITKLIQFLSEEVEGALTTLKIRGEQSVQYDFKPSTVNLYVNSKNTTPVKKRSPFCAFCDTNGHWPQDCNIVTDINSRKQKLKNSSMIPRLLKSKEKVNGLLSNRVRNGKNVKECVGDSNQIFVIIVMKKNTFHVIAQNADDPSFVLIAGLKGMESRTDQKHPIVHWRVLHKIITELKEQGIVRDNSSEYSSPVLLIKIISPNLVVTDLDTCCTSKGFKEFCMKYDD